MMERADAADPLAQEEILLPVLLQGIFHASVVVAKGEVDPDHPFFLQLKFQMQGFQE